MNENKLKALGALENAIKQLDELRAPAYPQKSHPGRAGRPPLPPDWRTQKRHFAVYILPALVNATREIGDGSLSRGIEILYDWYKYK